ncbi:MAG: flagellar assembly protein FliW [Oscillospiraceae bacterium]|nr:flagellar assembly protein FliW [Oscillospiraceae bacterium]
MEKELPYWDTNFQESSNILTFTTGILGFEDIHEYELLFTEDDSPFLFIQAYGYEHPCFVACDPVAFVPDYSVNYTDEILTELKADSKDDLRCLAITTMSDKITDITMNLKSPIVLNIKNNLAKQFVLDVLNYPIKYRIFNNDRAAK